MEKFTGGLSAAVSYVLGIIFIIAGCVSDEKVYYSCGFITIAGALFVQLCSGIYSAVAGHLPQIPEYDMEIIGNGFISGRKKALFRSGFGKMHEGDFDEALEDFCELKCEKLTKREEGALGFYMAVCYSRMGYPTNAGHCAATAVDNNVHIYESMLLAARSFALAGNTSEAADYYEKLLPYAEEKKMYPFIYNEMGKMYLSANDPENSRKYFSQAADKGLDPITAQGGLALVSLLEGKETEACERYRLALIARISDTDGFKEYCAQICVANGYPEDFFEAHLRERFARSGVNR